MYSDMVLHIQAWRRRPRLRVVVASRCPLGKHLNTTTEIIAEALSAKAPLPR
jgi:hypothetical protein